MSTPHHWTVTEEIQQCRTMRTMTNGNPRTPTPADYISALLSLPEADRATIREATGASQTEPASSLAQRVDALRQRDEARVVAALARQNADTFARKLDEVMKERDQDRADYDTTRKALYRQAVDARRDALTEAADLCGVRGWGLCGQAIRELRDGKGGTI